MEDDFEQQECAFEQPEPVATSEFSGAEAEEERPAPFAYQIGPTGEFYYGEATPGSRPATEQEILDMEDALAQQELVFEQPEPVDIPEPPAFDDEHTYVIPSGVPVPAPDDAEGEPASPIIIIEGEATEPSAYHVSATGALYYGDVTPGSRPATEQEILQHMGDPLENAKAAKLAEVMHAYSAAFAPIEDVYPAAEREGWPLQEAEAKAVLADPATETPVLSALVELRGRGESVAELAAKVLANAEQWRMIYAYLTGQQQHMYAAVTALAGRAGVTAEEVLAYPVGYRMPETE